MQIITDVRQRVQQLLQDNATTLLTAGGVVGIVATGVLAWRGGYKSAQVEVQEVIAESLQEDGSKAETTSDMTFGTKVKIAVPYLIPPVITGGVTIAAIIMANRMNAQQVAALAAAYGLSQKQLEEYKNKVAEKLGIQKEQKVQDELAQDRVNNTPGSNTIIVVEGEVLCFDQPTGRYFRSTMEKINSAVNCTNAEILTADYATASFFYEELELPATTWTDEVGWNRDRLVELSFSTVLSRDDKPCIAIDFKSLPKLDYIPKYY